MIGKQRSTTRISLMNNKAVRNKSPCSTGASAKPPTAPTGEIQSCKRETKITEEAFQCSIGTEADITTRRL